MISFSLSAIVAATTASEVIFNVVLNISVSLSIVNKNAKPATNCSGLKPIPLSIKAIVIKPPPGIPAQVLDATIANTAI